MPADQTDQSPVTITIVRQRTGDSGTFGTTKTAKTCTVLHTAELPWRNNKPDLSCIPVPDPAVGRYLVEMADSPHFGKPLYHIRGVKDRDNCLFHVGNWAGDVTKGFKSDVEGCIVLGRSLGSPVWTDAQGHDHPQDGVINSKSAIDLFYTELGGRPFYLEIVDETHLAGDFAPKPVVVTPVTVVNNLVTVAPAPTHQDVTPASTALGWKQFIKLLLEGW